MGIIFSTVWSKISSLWGESPCKVLILGLDGAGKTTLLYRMQLGDVIITHPTLGAAVEEVTYKNIKFTMWDMCGQAFLRDTWKLYYSGTHFIILVVDSTDTDARMEMLKKELFQLLVQEELKKTKLLILANKQDKKNALSAAEISKKLNLHKIHDHDWNIQACSALTGEGVMEGLEWISSKTAEALQS